MQEQQEQPDGTENPEQRDEINPKEDWTGRNIYVPDAEPDLLNAFDGEFDRFQYECDWDVRKQQHYYPVLIQAGVEALQEMDGDEFTERVDNLSLR